MSQDISFSSSPANPFRVTEWRWLRAKWLQQAKKRTRNFSDDEFTKTVRRYITLKTKCKEDFEFLELETRFPGIYWAEQIYINQHRETRWAIEARLLADEKFDSIADKVSTTPETILWYEKVFFNVIPHLRKLDYIATVVMGRSIHDGIQERDYDLLWKLLGYAYGPVMLDSIIMPFIGSSHINTADQVPSALEDLYTTSLTKKACISAMTVPTYYNQVNIMQLYNDIKRIAKESGGESLSLNSITNNVYATLSQLPFFSGKTHVEGRTKVDAPAIPFYDEQSAELRASEMVNVALDRDSDELRNMIKIKMPEVIDVTANTE